MYECTPVGIDYFTQAPYIFKAKVKVKCLPKDIFDCFEDHRSWPQWALPIKQVEWTSSKPFCVGTTRQVTMSGSLVADEVFIAWEYPSRMAFCFTHSSQQLIESFAEDYRVTDLGNGYVELEWIMGMSPKGIGRVSLFLFRPFMQAGLVWMLKRFKAHVEQKLAVS